MFSEERVPAMALRHFNRPVLPQYAAVSDASFADVGANMLNEKEIEIATDHGMITSVCWRISVLAGHNHRTLTEGDVRREHGGVWTLIVIHLLLVVLRVVEGVPLRCCWTLMFPKGQLHEVVNDCTDIIPTVWVKPPCWGAESAGNSMMAIMVHSTHSRKR